MSCSISFFTQFLLRNKDTNRAMQLVKVYLIRVMQSSYQEELEFLKYSDECHHHDRDKPPVLVNDLNLFIDENGILRSNGRISKSHHYDYEVQ